MFLDRYELPDGRVARFDQGGDTVSEGQAYAMLVATATGNRDRFEAAWRWASTHLLEADGLMAWHWASGRVVGNEPAADADVVAAFALFSAAGQFQQPSLAAAGSRMAGAILTQEVGHTAQGPVLLAGPWAAGPTPIADPSYLAVPLLDGLASRLGGEWHALAADADAQLLALVRAGRLPPDWAGVDADGNLQPNGPPGQPATKAEYGFDAVRVPIWLAISCAPSDRQAAASMLSALQRGEGELDLDLNGQPDPGTTTPLALVGEAASAEAAGQLALSRSLLSSGLAANAGHPTYYTTAVAAWAELGLTQHLGAC
jgi:endoglucanase